MSQADLELIRKVAADRAAVFVPEYQLVQKLKTPVGEGKASGRLPEDAFRDALRRLFPEMGDDEKTSLSNAVRNVRHPESLDPRVLAVAARFYRAYPAGFNITVVANPRALSQAETMSPDMDLYAKLVLQAQGVQGIDDLPRIKADILTYYYMLVDSEA